MTKMKGLFKGMKFISQIFVYKEHEMEHEMEIGYPTDVKHLVHFGVDENMSGNSPSWMNQFEPAASDFSSSSLSSLTHQKETLHVFEGKQKATPRPPKDVDQTRGVRPASALVADTTIPCSEKPKPPIKVKQKKTKVSCPTTPCLSPRGVCGRTTSEEQMVELLAKSK